MSGDLASLQQEVALAGGAIQTCDMLGRKPWQKLQMFPGIHTDPHRENRRKVTHVRTLQTRNEQKTHQDLVVLKKRAQMCRLDRKSVV